MIILDVLLSASHQIIHIYNAQRGITFYVESFIILFSSERNEGNQMGHTVHKKIVNRNKP